MGNKMRNANVDRIRGLAMLLVVLGHTMIGTTVGSESSFLFNIIWSLQMPLFMLISGYVTRYSRTVISVTALINVLKKRTMSYLLPWSTWTYLVRAFIWGQRNYFDIKWLLWHMDSGYWFLVSIWTISVIFTISSYLSEKTIAHAQSSKKTVGVAFFYLLGMMILLVVGKNLGLSFLCIKFTVYYMPFFFLGYLFGKLQDTIFGWSCGKKAVELTVAVSLGIWLFILNRVQLYNIGDDSVGILIRVVASVSGCCAVCGLMCKYTSENNKIGGVLHWFGVHSLEVYTGHYLVLNLIPTRRAPEFLSVNGFALTAANYLLSLILVWALVVALNSNSMLKKLLLGKDC